jgi:signal transduction histidine kinase/DNA-binding response OmpR family regulator
VTLTLVVAIASVVVIAALAAERRRQISARRRLERSVVELRAELDRIEASERARSEFMATASHELRSPLTSIKGFAELLTSGPYAASIPARQREFVEIIGRSSDRLVELVNELLDVARLNSDQTVVDRRPVDVGEAVRETVELLGARIAGKHQQIGVDIAANLPPALADANKLRQVIGNLVTNAHLYTPAGGRIRVRAEADRAWVRIVVADSGIGMSEEEAEHVFDRFYRAPGRAGGVPGTGLGLAIVKSLVDLQGGQVSVTSRPEGGSAFAVRLPSAPTRTETTVEVLRGRRILIVDDDRTIAALIADQLASLEVETVVADGVESAREAIAGEHVDALTVNARIGPSDGIELVRRIRSDRDLQSVPAVFVTVDVGLPELAGEFVVRQPIDADELQGALIAAIRSTRPRVLAIGRMETQARVEPALDELGIEYEWETTGADAVRISGERRFEVALVDLGLRNPEAVLQALELRGRRLRKAVILFTDGDAPVSTSLSRQAADIVPIEHAADAVLATLRGRPQRAMVTSDGSSGAR